MSTGTIEARVRIDASTHAVYTALTDEVGLRIWFAEEVQVDIDRDRYEFAGRYTPGTPQSGSGMKLLQAERGRKLAYTWPVGGEDTDVTISLDAINAATDLTLVHRPLSKDSAWLFECFWSIALENLRAYVERGEPGLRFDFSNIPVGDVELTTEIEAAPEAVFEALIDPAQLDRYMSGNPARIEPRPGGDYDIGWGDHGPLKVLDLEPARRLSYSWRGEPAEVGETIVTWRLEGSAGRTRLTLVHSGFATDRTGMDYGIGWLDFLNRIRQMVEVGDSWRKPEIRVVEDRNARNEGDYLPSAGIHDPVASTATRTADEDGQ